MIKILLILNLTLMAAVFGYAVAASTVGYPAMMSVSRKAAIEYFKPFFHKSAHLQLGISLAVLSVSLALSLLRQGWLWTFGAVVLQASGPYTLKILMPVNNRIMAEQADPDSPQMISDLGSWGKLHLPRTLLAGLIFILFVFLAISG